MRHNHCGKKIRRLLVSKVKVKQRSGIAVHCWFYLQDAASVASNNRKVMVSQLFGEIAIEFLPGSP